MRPGYPGVSQSTRREPLDFWEGLRGPWAGAHGSETHVNAVELDRFVAGK